MTVQHPLSVVAPIKPDEVAALKTHLDLIGDDVLNKKGKQPNPFPFQKLSTVHFMRWTVLDEVYDPEKEGKKIGAQLAMETNFDGPLEQHLEELVTQGGPALAKIYGHCQGFPAASGQTPQEIRNYLLAHRYPVPTFYVGTRGLSVSQIRSDQELRTQIESFLDGCRKNPAWFEKSAADLRTDIQGYVRSVPALARALTPAPSTALAEFFALLGGILNVGARALLPLALIFFGVHYAFGVSWGVSGLAVLGALLALIGCLLAHELTEPETKDTTDPPQTRQIARREDHQTQNQMTDIVFVKSGPFRQVILRSVLWTINWAARYIFNQGELGGIPSIHFARWVILDGGRRLLFFSNFDGSWESYLDDFIDKAAHGLTAVWGNAYLFPRSYFLLWGGARDEQRFKPYVRRTQLATEAWYSAYPDLSVQNINNNARIRRMLSGNPDPVEIEACLRLL
jgi:hypothetical protein